MDFDHMSDVANFAGAFQRQQLAKQNEQQAQLLSQQANIMERTRIAAEKQAEYQRKQLQGQEREWDRVRQKEHDTEEARKALASVDMMLRQLKLKYDK
jgi:hypothetical protein